MEIIDPINLDPAFQMIAPIIGIPNNTSISCIKSLPTHTPVLRQWSNIVLPDQEISLVISSVFDREVFIMSKSGKFKYPDHLFILAIPKLNSDEEKLNRNVQEKDFPETTKYASIGTLCEVVDFDDDIVDQTNVNFIFERTAFSVKVKGLTLLKVDQLLWGRCEVNSPEREGLFSNSRFQHLFAKTSPVKMSPSKSIRHDKLEIFQRKITSALQQFLLIDKQDEIHKPNVTSAKKILSWFFKVLNKLPVSDIQKLYLLTQSDYVEKLRLCHKILNAMKENCEYHCSGCFRRRNPLFQTRNLICIPGNSNGASGCYVNPGGIVHDTVTVELEADQIGVTLDLALPCLKDTWFPGYGWIPSYRCIVLSN